MHYSYLNNGTISSLASSGNLRMTIPIQVCEGEFLSKPTVSSRLSIPYLVKDVPVNVKLKTPSTRIRQQEYLISFAAPENCATNHDPSSNCEGEYLPRDRAMPMNQLSPETAQPQYRLYYCIDDPLRTACEGDAQEHPTRLTVHPTSSSIQLTVVPNDYCCVALPSIHCIT